MVVIAFACSTSKITSSWKAPNTTPQKYNKILVLGLIHDKDRSIQEKMEDHFVGDLQDLGYNAVSSLKEFGPKVFDKMTEEAALLSLKSSGIDAVLTIVLLDKEKERKYIPGNVYNRFWGYRSEYYTRIYEPGYYVTKTKYFWESNFWNMSTQNLIFSAQTKTFDPDDMESMGHEYGLMIVKKMVQEKILQQENKDANP
jgi:hypothetical protein